MAETEQPWQVGEQVEVVRGKKAPVGTRGVVFWVKYVERQYSDCESTIYRAWRIGLKDEHGTKHWVRADEVREVKAPEAPGLSLDKGERVRWEKDGGSGTGVIFWVGESKYGPGKRVGLKDDEGAGTLWLDEIQVHPLPQGGLARLREVLYQDPSEEAWRQIYESFEGWAEGDDVLQVGLDYASEHLQSWPDQLRVLPGPHVKALRLGRTPPAFSLVRSVRFADEVDFKAGRYTPQLGNFEALPGVDMGHITHLDMNSRHVPSGVIVELLESLEASGARPKRLGLNTRGQTQECVSLLAASEVASELEELELNCLDDAGAVGLATSPHLRRLWYLEIEDTRVGLVGARAMFASQWLQSTVRELGADFVTAKELKGLAKELELSGYSKLRKAELARQIVAALGPGLVDVESA